VLRLITLIGWAGAVLSAHAWAQSPVDDSGLDRYWSLQGRLAREVEPSSAAWDSLWSTPGYAALHARERRRPTLTLAIRLAALPSLADSAARVVARGGFLGRSVAHLGEANRHRDSLIRLTPSLRALVVEAMGQGRRATGRMLGDSLVAAHPPPPLALLLFAPDGRGYPQLIIGDLLHLSREASPAEFFAHEFFHTYRRLVARAPGVVPPSERPWLDAVTVVEEEGLADQLDKRDIPDLTPTQLDARYPAPGDLAFYREYWNAVRDGARWVRFADSALAATTATDSLRTVAGRAFAAALPIGGRPLGAFMARTIAGAFPDRRLGALAGDPIAFWLRYHDAAGRVGSPGFSPATLAALGRLGGYLGPAAR
jgi:hypothetical protein